MTNQGLHHQTGIEGEKAEAKWQKHVMTAVWVALALFVSLTASLVYWHYRGAVRPSPDHATPVAPWPDSQP